MYVWFAMNTETKHRPGLTWAQVCEDPSLQNLPYKVETNRHGQVVLSPHKRYHSRLQARIVDELRDQAEGGVRFVELAVDTPEGAKVPDVAWMSDKRNASIPEDAEPAPIAPEICIEVRSTSNTDAEIEQKRALYFEAGAEEVWLCDREGQLRFFNAEGERAHSSRVPSFPRNLSRQ